MYVMGLDEAAVTMLSDATTAEHSIGTRRVRLVASPIWDGRRITAYMQTDAGVSARVIVDDGVFTIPGAMLAHDGILQIAFHGVADDGTVMTSDIIRLRIRRSLADGTDVPEPSPTALEQIQQEIASRTLDDAPRDTRVYGRSDGRWTPVVIPPAQVLHSSDASLSIKDDGEGGKDITLSADLHKAISDSTAADARQDTAISGLRSQVAAIGSTAVASSDGTIAVQRASDGSHDIGVAKSITNAVAASTAADTRQDADIVDIKADVAKSKTDIAALGSRVDGIGSTDVTSKDGTVTVAKADDGSHDIGVAKTITDAVAASTAADTRQDADIASVKTDVAGVRSDITQAQTDISGIKDDVAAIGSTDVTSQNGTITVTKAQDGSHDVGVAKAITDAVDASTRKDVQQDTRLNALRSDVDGHTTSITDLTHRLDGVRPTKVTSPDGSITVTTDGAGDVAAQVSQAIQDSVTTSASAVTDHKTRLDGLDTSMAAAQSDITSAKSQIAALGPRVTATESTIADHTAQIAAATEQGSKNEAAIERLQSMVSIREVVRKRADLPDPATVEDSAGAIVLQDETADGGTTMWIATGSPRAWVSIGGLGDVDLTQYYTKAEVDAAQAAQDTKITANADATQAAQSDASSALQRVTAAESSIEGQSSDIGSLRTRVATAEGSIATHTSQIADAAKRIADLDGTVAALPTDVTSADGSIAVAKTDTGARDLKVATALQQDIADAKAADTRQDADIVDIKADVAKSKTDIAALGSRVDGIGSTDVTSKDGTVTVAKADDGSHDIGVAKTITDAVAASTAADTRQDADIASVKTDVAGVRSDITQAQTDISGIKDDVAAIGSTAVTSQDGTITVNKKTDGSHDVGVSKTITDALAASTAADTRQDSDIESLQTDVTKAKADITALGSRVDGISSTVITSKDGSITVTDAADGSRDLAIGSDLRSEISAATSGVATNAAAITAVQTGVTALQGAKITSTDGSITVTGTPLSRDLTVSSLVTRRIASTESGLTSESIARKNADAALGARIDAIISAPARGLPLYTTTDAPGRGQSTIDVGIPGIKDLLITGKPFGVYIRHDDFAALQASVGGPIDMSMWRIFDSTDSAVTNRRAEALHPRWMCGLTLGAGDGLMMVMRPPRMTSPGSSGWTMDIIDVCTADTAAQMADSATIEPPMLESYRMYGRQGITIVTGDAIGPQSPSQVFDVMGVFGYTAHGSTRSLPSVELYRNGTVGSVIMAHYSSSEGTPSSVDGSVTLSTRALMAQGRVRGAGSTFAWVPDGSQRLVLTGYALGAGVPVTVRIQTDPSQAVSVASTSSVASVRVPSSIVVFQPDPTSHPITDDSLILHGDGSRYDDSN